TRLGAQRPRPRAPVGPVCTVSLQTTVASNLPTYRRWRSSETLRDPTYRPTGRNPTRNLFALLKLQRRNSSATYQRRHRSEEHTSELQSRPHLVCRLLLEKKKKTNVPILFIFKKKKYNNQQL